MKKELIVLLVCLIIIVISFCGCLDDDVETKDDDSDDYDDDIIDEVDFDEDWRSETVDDTGWVGIDSAIDVDKSGNPHISHYDQGNRDLKYAYFDGSHWNLETVDSEGDIGEASDIVVDKNEYPHISYIDVTTRSLKYAVKKQSGWEIEIVETPSAGLQVMTTSIELDANDYLHIAYSTSPGIKYSYWDGSSWIIEEVLDKGYGLSFTLDSNDDPHVVYRWSDPDEDIERLEYATKKEGQWIFATIDSSPGDGGDCSIAVDSNNIPHVAYNAHIDESLRYAKLVDESWIIETISEDIGSEEGVRIFVDKNDIVHVVYADYNNDPGTLVYAKKSADSWVFEIFDRSGNPSLVVDHLERVHVSHGFSVDEDPTQYIPDSTEKSIEILKYSIRE